MRRRKGFIGALAFLCVFYFLASVGPGDAFGDWLDSLVQERVKANDEAAKVHLRVLVTASESYKAAHERYPEDEGELLGSEDEPAYIYRTYDGQEIMGYEFGVKFEDESYQFIAKPVKCRETGSKIFIVESGKETMELDCK